jgi:hypothetical protein
MLYKDPDLGASHLSTLGVMFFIIVIIALVWGLRNKSRGQ